MPDDNMGASLNNSMLLLALGLWTLMATEKYRIEEREREREHQEDKTSHISAT
jgi:hypothetical protein